MSAFVLLTPCVRTFWSLELSTCKFLLLCNAGKKVDFACSIISLFHGGLSYMVGGGIVYSILALRGLEITVVILSIVSMYQCIRSLINSTRFSKVSVQDASTSNIYTLL